MISQPKIRYTFDIKDATLFYSSYDNSMNIETQESIEFEDGLCITGIEPETVFTMCRSVLASSEPIQYKFIAKDWHVKYAKEMITALLEFVDSKEKKDDTTADS